MRTCRECGKEYEYNRADASPLSDYYFCSECQSKKIPAMIIEQEAALRIGLQKISSGVYRIPVGLRPAGDEREGIGYAISVRDGRFFYTLKTWDCPEGTAHENPLTELERVQQSPAPPMSAVSYEDLMEKVQADEADE